MKHIVVIIIICGCMASLAFTNPPAKSDIGVSRTLAYIKEQGRLFAQTTSDLEETVGSIDRQHPESITRAKDALRQSRLQYKTIEFFLSYFLKSATLVYNEANKYEVEEPFIEAREPAGFQVIEALLFSNEAGEKKQELTQQANLVNTSAQDITSLLYNLDISDKQLLESFRIELIRVMTLGITGFDAPELKTGIGESKQVLVSMQKNLYPFLQNKGKQADSIRAYLAKAISILNPSIDFDSFDRMTFFTRAALPLQSHLGLFIKQTGLELNSTGTLNYQVSNLFSKNAIVLQPASVHSKVLIELGRKLFFEKRLSQNTTRSCANCHKPEKYFSDGLAKSIAMDGRSTVSRNAPSLYYSTYQYAQFWDGRAKTLEEQIRIVLDNPKEMGGDHKVAINNLRESATYQLNFKNVFGKKVDNVIDMSTVSKAITAFLETLSPMNSAFDQYMNGNEKTLNVGQIRGFNLFMGKAKCGTCHYAPMFNGLTAPLYNRTELEVLGLTANANFNRPELDNDNGRYASFPIPYYRGAFKTPTLRNVAKTAPYMHNGNFLTLEEVMDFYNKGGAAGMGLDMPTQTLNARPLDLNKKEIKDIISFLYALTDSQTEK